MVGENRREAGTTSTRKWTLVPRVPMTRKPDAPCGERPHADVLHLRHHRLSQDRRAQLQVRPGPLHHRQILALRRTRTGCTSPSPTPAGARPCGASSTASGCARRRCSPTTLTSFDAARHPAHVRQVPYHHLLRAAHHVPLCSSRRTSPSTTCPPSSTATTAGEALNPEVYRAVREGHRPVS